jgi:hypothetical protein
VPARESGVLRGLLVGAEVDVHGRGGRVYTQVQLLRVGEQQAAADGGAEASVCGLDHAVGRVRVVLGERAADAGAGREQGEGLVVRAEAVAGVLDGGAVGGAVASGGAGVGRDHAAVCSPQRGPDPGVSGQAQERRVGAQAGRRRDPRHQRLVGQDDRRVGPEQRQALSRVSRLVRPGRRPRVAARRRVPRLPHPPRPEAAHRAAVNGKRNSNSGAGAGADDDDDDRKSLGSLFGDEDEEDDDQGEGANVKREEKPSGGGGGVNEEEPPGRVQTSQSVFLSASIDGTVDIWDRRQERKAGHLYVPQGVPPWCTSACWSTDGNCIFVGRRNSTVDEFDIRTSLTKQTRSFKFPSVSGAVSNVRAMPSGRHLLCGSHDNVRLYDLQASPKSKTPFYIVPGHHGAVLSSIHVDPSCQFMVTTSGNRGWQGNSTDVALIYEIEPQ